MDLKSLDPRSFSLGTIHHDTEHLLQRRGPIRCCRVSVYHFSSGKSSALPFHFDTLVHYGRNLELPFERLQQSQISLTTNPDRAEVSVPWNISAGSKECYSLT